MVKAAKLARELGWEYEPAPPALESTPPQIAPERPVIFDVPVRDTVEEAERDRQVYGTGILRVPHA